MQHRNLPVYAFTSESGTAFTGGLSILNRQNHVGLGFAGFERELLACSLGCLAGVEPERGDLDELLARPDEFQLIACRRRRSGRRVVVAVLEPVGGAGADLAARDRLAGRVGDATADPAPAVSAGARCRAGSPGLVRNGGERRWPMSAIGQYLPS